MLHFRPFLNTDPPLIAELWRSLPQRRAILEAMTHRILDEHVLSKPYFDRYGLILALDADFENDVESNVTPRGIIHAGFAPNGNLSDIDTSHGIISMMQVIDGEDSDEAADGLLKAAKEYLTRRGAEKISIGSRFPFAPFYSGIYGGSRVPGCLACDMRTREACERNGFQPAETVLIFNRALNGFRPVVNRVQMAIRRRVQINASVDPVESNWWESCTLGMAQREKFKVVERASQQLLGSATFWDVQPLATEWGVNARGLYELKTGPEASGDPECPVDEGMELFLLGESLRHLMQEGVSLVEIQVLETDLSMIATLDKLGFQQIDRGTLLHLETR